MPSKSVPILLDKTRNLKYDYNAACALEEATGKSVFEFIAQLKVLGENKNLIMKLSDIRVLVWAGLLHERETLSLNSVGKILDNAEVFTSVEKLNTVSETIAMALLSSCFIPSKETKDEDAEKKDSRPEPKKEPGKST